MTEAEFRPIQRAAKALGLVFLVVATMSLATNVNDAFGADFMSFWAASVLAVGGDPAAAYDVEAHHAVQAQVATIDGWMPFFYPPPFLLLLLPLGLLPYWAAALTWTVGTFGAYLAAARRLLPGSGWLVVAYPAVIANAIIGQNGFLTAAIFIGGLLALPRRPLLGGLLLGCLVVKPHLALLLPLAFLAARQWQAIAGAALGSVGLLLLSNLLFGAATYQAFFDQTHLSAGILADGSVGWHKMASVYASLRLLGLSAYTAAVLHGAAALAAAAATWCVWRKQIAWEAKGAALASATLLISPYLYLYDTLILVMPFLWLLTVERRRGLLLLLWCVPLFSFAQNWGLNGLLNLTPLVSITLLFLVCRRLLTNAAPPRPSTTDSAPAAVISG